METDEYKNYTDPNQYTGTDIERINSAVRDARKTGGCVRIFKRRPDAESQRDYWLIDSAILLPEDTLLYIVNCKIKLSDKARDNWIRSANCVVGSTEVNKISGIHIIGEGSAVLEGADHPRSTGDGGKELGVRTYGTDAGKAGQRQKGDWRNIGILLVRVSDFSIRNLKMVNSHAWAVSLEFCENGILGDLHFESDQIQEIDGKPERILNRDGIDLRKGCRNITIRDITGYSGDDLIALTALPHKEMNTGTFNSTAFYSNPCSLDEMDLFNISIHNVRGYCAGGHHIIRLLNNGGIKLHHVQISGLIDTSPAGKQCRAAVKIGDAAYGGAAPLGDTSDIQICGVHSKAKFAVLIGGALGNSMISDVLNYEPSNNGVALQLGNEKTEGLFLNNIRTVGVGGVKIDGNGN